MQVLKQTFARRLLRRLRTDPRHNQFWNFPLDEGHIWQRRFYDFAVWTERKRFEKLPYMHRNPVKRGFVSDPGQWPWSSFRYYAFGEPGPVLVNEQRKATLRINKIAS